MMNIYDFGTIKEAVPISRYLADRDIEVHGNRFAAEWRGSSDPNLTISSDDRAYCDHARGQQGGSVIDLCMEVEAIATPFFAAQTLGDRYHLTPKTAPVKVILPTDGTPVPRYMELRSKGWELVATYVYTDEEGRELYSVLRMHDPATGKKTFLQRTADHWGLENVRRVLYNLPAVIKAETVYVVEGEKDADTLIRLGLCATTNNGGAKNWEPDFNRFFQGKHVVILCDNDEPGVAHAKEVLRQINDTAADIKVLSPSSLPKGDVTDYLEKEGGTLESLLALIERQPFHDRQAASAANALYTIEEARALNVEPFRNFREEETTDKNGKEKTVERPIQVIQLVQECRRRFLDFPRRLSGTLFDRDLKTGEIVQLPAPDALMSWIALKSKQPIEWSRVRGAVSQAQFFQALMLSVRAYDGISRAPHFPLRTDIFYINKPLPQIDPDAPSKLDALVARFAPAAPVYVPLIKCFFMAPTFFGKNAPRPAWLIDSVDGKGVGKTTLVKMLAFLYDEKPIDIDVAAIKNDLTAIVKRLISAEGRSRRIALLDNIQGTFRSANLARLITTDSISGIAPYGHGEETRLNDLTYILTSNAASIDDDLAQRAYTIKLRRAVRAVSWESETRSFIDLNRETIFAEIIAALSSPNVLIDEAVTRYPEFERAVLCAACKDRAEYDAVVKVLLADVDEANVTTDRAQEVADVFRDAIASVLTGVQGASIKRPTFLNIAAISRIITTSDTLRIENIKKGEIMEMIQSGNIDQFSRKVKTLWVGGRAVRGLLWLSEWEPKEDETVYVNIVEVEKDALVYRFTEAHAFREV